MLDGRQSHLDSIIPSQSQIQYLDKKWPSKIKSRCRNFDVTDIRYSPAASFESAL